MLQHRIDYLPPSAIKPRLRQWRTHTPRQLEFMCASLRARGPVEFPLVDSSDRLVCGSLMVEAAKAIGLNEIPILRVEHMTDAALREYALAAARIAELSGMDELLIGEELRELEELLAEPDFGSLGWESAELDRILQLTDNDLGLADDEVVEPGNSPAVSQNGDRWLINDHVLQHGDALVEENHCRLMDGELSRFTLTDGPYNLPASTISGNGRFQHDDFVMGAGEMSPGEFTRFWTRTMRNIASVSMDGSLHAFFMGGQYLLELLRAGAIVFGRPKAICTWVKRQGGQGALFRSQTEFIAYFKLGTAKHQNSVMLGKYGRNRTTAWMYDGMNTMSVERDELLAIHPTCKPVEMLSDAILDVTKRGDIVLDPFAGSGSTIIAAERTERRARCLELDPLYVDASLRRVRKALGYDAVRERDGVKFSDAEAAVLQAMEGES